MWVIAQCAGLKPTVPQLAGRHDSRQTRRHQLRASSMQIPGSNEHRRMPQPVPEAVKGLTGVDGQGGGGVAEVVATDGGEARGAAMLPHVVGDGRNGQPPILVPGPATPEERLVVGFAHRRRRRAGAIGRLPRLPRTRRRRLAVMRLCCLVAQPSARRGRNVRSTDVAPEKSHPKTRRPASLQVVLSQQVVWYAARDLNPEPTD